MKPAGPLLKARNLDRKRAQRLKLLDFIRDPVIHMIRSMTGYGAGYALENQRTVSVEIRSTNHRFLDLNIRIPREYSFLEAEIAQLLRASLRRGRIELHAAVQGPVPAESLLDMDVAAGFVGAAERLRERFHLEDALDLKTLMSLPGVVRNRDALRVPGQAVDGDVSRLLLECTREALQHLVAVREREGAALARTMRGSLEQVGAALAELRARMPRSVEKHRQRLAERLERLAPDIAVDPQRVAQEVALMAERSDFAEELVRLESHANEFGRLLQCEEPVGKELDFLIQEMQREINTTLAKSADLDITRPALAAKAEIERLREQVQNIE